MDEAARERARRLAMRDGDRRNRREGAGLMGYGGADLNGGNAGPPGDNPSPSKAPVALDRR